MPWALPRRSIPAGLDTQTTSDKNNDDVNQICVTATKAEIFSPLQQAANNSAQ